MTPYIEDLGLKPETIEVMQRGLAHITSHYANWDYHNPTHAIEVPEDGLRIATAMHLPFGTLNDVAISGVWHDAEQALDGGQNEIVSSRMARSAMIQVGSFTSRHLYQVDQMICSTTVEPTEDGEIKHPLLGDDLASKVLVDADMANLGKEPHIFRAHFQGLFRERNPGEPLDGRKMYQAIGKTIVLLSTFKFNTPAAQELFPHIEDNLDLLSVEETAIRNRLDLVA